MTVSAAVFVFVLGLIFGSFLNVCIYRLPRNESILWPRSRCPVCQTPIRPQDNIPVLSFLLLRGRCRQCGARISTRYPMVELLTGVLFLLIYLKYGIQTQMLGALLLVCILVVITFVDIEYKLILNKVTIPGIVLGLLVSAFLLHANWKDLLLGPLFGGGLLFGIALVGELLFGKESMGMGDVKMGAMVGAFLGPKGAVVAIFLGFLIAGLFSAGGMAARWIGRKSYLPFGPFIAAGTLLYVLAGENLIRWYLHLVGLQ